MRFTTTSQIADLVAHGVVESASLEFKRELHLDKRAERSEALKDLSGMANGGGGTVIYGVEEDASMDWPLAKAVTPLADRGLLSRLENIVRDGVHPPLLVEYAVIEHDGGYVLAVDVRRSPIGPYMVEAYGDRRHYSRVGTSVSKMSEREVADAYALVMRVAERRPRLWEQHRLPVTAPNPDLWLIVSALPNEPMTDVLDMRTVNADDLVPPPDSAAMTYINNLSLGNLTPALRSLARWVDGFHGSDASDRAPVEHLVRLHRDGAAAIATRLHHDPGEPVWTTRVFRVLNTALLYLGWLWDSYGLNNAVELQIDLHNLAQFSFHSASQVTNPSDLVRVTGPDGIAVDPVSTAEYVIPWQLRKANYRHAIVLRFADRLHQALGEARAEAPFRCGLLYDDNGACINVSVHPSVVWDEKQSAGHIAWVHEDGSISSTHTGEIVGWYMDGVVVDLNGDTVAVLEFAPGTACPDDFVGATVCRDPGGQGSRFSGTPQPHALSQTPPDPTGRWASVDIRTLVYA